MREKMAIDFLGAILRLGKKYDIDYLCEQSLKRLRLEFPTTLEKWHACFEEGTYLKKYTHIKRGDATNLESTVLGLCHELSICSCLPSAYLLFVAHSTLASSPLPPLLMLADIICNFRKISLGVLLTMEERWIVKL